MVEVNNIFKSFDDNEVLKNISAVFEPGKTNLIIGASGSGKTTFIKCMVGLHDRDSGTILYDGRDLNLITNKEQKELRQEMGMLFQGGALFDSMTVEENICFPLNMFTKDTAQEKLNRVNECLERVNLSGTNKLNPDELSGGMKKRVGIARAISMKPKYLFCDEPNSGLDPMNAIVIDELIQEITKDLNITTIINTHDMNSVLAIGDKVLFLHKGEKWWEGNKSEIRDTDNPELNEFVFANKFITK
ncbi:MAG: phospholipid/cholesterol/gamma-HCH transport system ATP-binding protein [Sphingobacteriales bacterium]|jgi:phospholipid/cholesterol/gamma-HCH transport system ATP-binding protein